MKKLILIFNLIMPIVLGVKNFAVISNSSKNVLISSIDFICDRHFYDYEKDFFIKCNVYEFSESSKDFSYILTEHFYLNELIELKDDYVFFRAKNNMVVVVDEKMKNYFNKTYCLKDSLFALDKNLNLSTSDTLIIRDLMWNRYRVKYINDTLYGSMSGTPIKFNRFDINKY